MGHGGRGRYRRVVRGLVMSLEMRFHMDAVRHCEIRDEQLGLFEG